MLFWCRPILKCIKLKFCCRGIKQLIAEKGSKAALLVIHLCSIEVRMTLEQDDNHKVYIIGSTI